MKASATRAEVSEKPDSSRSPVPFGEEVGYRSLAQSEELWQGLPDPGHVDRVLQDTHSMVLR